MQQTKNNFVHNNLLDLLARHCSGKQQAKFVCFTEKCKQNAFVCENKKCYCNFQKHRICSSIKTIQQLTNILGMQKCQVPSHIQQYFNDIIQSYDQIIDQLSMDRIQFIEFTQMFGMSQKTVKVMRLINQDKNEHIDGNLLNSIWNQLSKQAKLYLPKKIDIHEYELQIRSLQENLIYELVDLSQRTRMTAEKINEQNLQLDKIYLSERNWEIIPVQITGFTKLKSLKIQNCSIKIISHLENLIHLQYLNLSFNHIKHIKKLEKLKNLQTLQLTNNQIEKIEGLDKLSNLKELRLGNNKICKIQNLDKLIQLTGIGLGGNPITVLENLEKLQKLQRLGLSGCKITKLDGIHSLKYLKILSLGSCCIKKGDNPLLENEQQYKIIQTMRKKYINVRVNK